MNEPLAALVAAVHEHDWSCSEGGHANEPDGCPECEHFRQLALTAIPPDAVLVTEARLAAALFSVNVLPFAEEGGYELHETAAAVMAALRAKS